MLSKSTNLATHGMKLCEEGEQRYFAKTAFSIQSCEFWNYLNHRSITLVSFHVTCYGLRFCVEVLKIKQKTYTVVFGCVGDSDISTFICLSHHLLRLLGLFSHYRLIGSLLVCCNTPAPTFSFHSSCRLHLVIPLRDSHSFVHEWPLHVYSFLYSSWMMFRKVSWTWHLSKLPGPELLVKKYPRERSLRTTGWDSSAAILGLPTTFIVVFILIIF